MCLANWKKIDEILAELLVVKVLPNMVDTNLVFRLLCVLFM